MNTDFYKDKRVFLTGHTGFKGAWLAKVLVKLGAKVCGYSLPPEKDQPLFEASGVSADIINVYGDIRDFALLKQTLESFSPDIVIHMAAQALVRSSYANPLFTYSTNVMGTMNLLEAVRIYGKVRSVVNVTTDKVYRNNEEKGKYYIETDLLDGFDPYSNSKSCSELIGNCYRRSFNIPLSSCRAGNVIGGGDFSKDRIIPDCVRATNKGDVILIRNPSSSRPYQYVLDPIFAYLLTAKSQYLDSSLCGAYNVGPDNSECVSTLELASIFCRVWGTGAKYEIRREENPLHEAKWLGLNPSKIKNILGWKKLYSIEEAVEKTVAGYKAMLRNDMDEFMDKEIYEFIDKVEYNF